MTGSAKWILAVVTIAAAAALGTAGVATASDGAVRPDDRAIHGTGAVALEHSDRVVRPDDRADRSITATVASERDSVLRPDDRANRLLPGGAVTTTRIVDSQPEATFDWLDAGIGAASALGLVLVGGAILTAASRRRKVVVAG